MALRMNGGVPVLLSWKYVELLVLSGPVALKNARSDAYLSFFGRQPLRHFLYRAVPNASNCRGADATRHGLPCPPKWWPSAILFATTDATACWQSSFVPPASA